MLCGLLNATFDRLIRVSQNTNMSIFLSSLAIFPFLLMQGFQKCQKKLKKLTFCPSPRAFFVYSIAAYYASQPTLSYTKIHLPNVAQSTSNPPRTVVDLRKYDPRSLDHQNWSTGREIIGFSIHQKIAQYCSKDNFPLNTPKTYQMISNHHLAHSERFCT